MLGEMSKFQTCFIILPGYLSYILSSDFQQSISRNLIWFLKLCSFCSFWFMSCWTCVSLTKVANHICRIYQEHTKTDLTEEREECETERGPYTATFACLFSALRAEYTNGSAYGTLSGDYSPIVMVGNSVRVTGALRPDLVYTLTLTVCLFAGFFVCLFCLFVGWFVYLFVLFWSPFFFFSFYFEHRQ